MAGAKDEGRDEFGEGGTSLSLYPDGVHDPFAYAASFVAPDEGAAAHGGAGSASMTEGSDAVGAIAADALASSGRHGHLDGQPSVPAAATPPVSDIVPDALRLGRHEEARLEGNEASTPASKAGGSEPVLGSLPRLSGEAAAATLPVRVTATPPAPPPERRLTSREQARRRRQRLALLRRREIAGEAELAPYGEPRRPPRSLGASLTRGVVQVALMGGVLVGSFIVMQDLLDAKPERAARERPPQIVPIRTVEAVPADNQPTLNLFGTITTGRALDLRAEVPGEIVRVAPSLRAGVRVEEGDELVVIDDFDARASLAEARATLAEMQGRIAETEARIAAEEAQIAAAEEQEDLAREDLARTDRLVERGTVSAAQRDQRRIALSQASQGVVTRRANLDVQRAQLATLESQIRRLELGVEQAERAVADAVMTAPFDAVVRSSVAEIGREVNAGETLVSLYDDRDLEARFVLTDAQFGRLATDRDPLVGRPVEVTWTIGGDPFAFDAEVVRIGAEIASERGGVEVLARIEPGDGAVALRPGAFVELSLPDRTFENTFRVPETALYDESAVYVNEDGQLRRRSVLRLAQDGEDVIVRPDGDAPLRTGERVMTTRISRVDEGMRVREPDREEADAPAGADRENVPVAGGGEAREAMLTRVAEANDITLDDLRAMPADERRAMVRAFRQASGDGAGFPRGPRGAARGI